MSNNNVYKDFLKEKLVRYFDIKEDCNYLGENFDLFATFKQRNARYMISKKMEIYSFEENEFIFYRKLNKRFIIDDLENIDSFINTNVDEIINISKDHMSSFITFILETELPIDSVTAKKIEKFKFYKSYMFGLKGWVNAKIMVINTKENQLVANKLGQRDVKKFCPAS